jgi:hypothetical protein
MRPVRGEPVDVAPVQLVEGSRLTRGEAAAEALVGKPLEQTRAHILVTGADGEPD